MGKLTFLGTLHRSLALTIIVLMLASFPIGIYTFFSPDVTASKVWAPIGPISVFFAGIPLVTHISLNAATVFVTVWIIYLSFFLYLGLIEKPSIKVSLKNLTKDSENRFFENNVASLAYYFPPLLVATRLLELLQESVGLPTGSLRFDSIAVAYTTLTVAPLMEEAGFRLTIIGLLGALLSSGADGRKRFLEVLWRPSLHLKSGRHESHELLVNTLIVFSSLSFGFAHYAYGSGWAIGKVTTATIAGFVISWCYVKRGFLTAVLLHWAFNYYEGTLYYFRIIFAYSAFSFILEAVLFAAGFLCLLLLVLKRRSGVPN